MEKLIKNKIYNGVVEGLGTDGEGVIKIEGATVFVPFCLVGEKVDFKILKVKGNVAYGKAENVENKAYSRTNPPCPVFYKCGGCDIQHMNYPAQLDFKRAQVAAALKKIGGIDADVSPCVASKNQFRYRNKLALPIGTAGCGFYARHSHRIVPIKDCPIQSEWIKYVISVIENSGLEGYDEDTGKGILRRIVVREIGGKFIFALVVTRKVKVDNIISELEKRFENFTFLLNINAGKTNAIFSKEWHICRGTGFFGAESAGIKYRAGANTFLQVNDEVKTALYSAVLAEANAGDAVIDLYSGGGLLTAMLAKKCGTAYGIEIVEEASKCADELREENGLSGKMFNICGAVEDKIDEVFALTQGKKAIIVCDPPRKGMERSVVNAIKSASPDKVVLVSCNPATLARDLGLLLGTLKEVDGELKKAEPDDEYKIKKIAPYDMFPQTKWCETLAVIEKSRR